MTNNNISLLSDIEFQEKLNGLGFKKLGSGWFGNEIDDIRIRLWKNCEVDFWLWRNSENTNDNQILFRGKIFNIDDVKWVLSHCFDLNLKDKQRNIAVISNNMQDFKQWRIDNNLYVNNLSLKMFELNNCMYYRISSLNDLHSMSFDEVVETIDATKNKEYEEIKSLIKICMNSN